MRYTERVSRVVRMRSGLRVLHSTNTQISWMSRNSLLREALSSRSLACVP